MSELRKAAQEALEFCEFLWRDVMMNDYSFERLEQNITALKQALAEPECPHGADAECKECYDQTALDLCGVCGWRTLIPGDACLNCERAKPEQPVPLNDGRLTQYPGGSIGVGTPAKPEQEPVTLPANLSESAPKRIWLGLFTDETDPHFPGDHEGICWAEDDFADVNVPYVRADLVAAPTPRKPLTEKELNDLRQADGGALNFVTLRAFRIIARAIEAAHGITGEQT